MYVLVVYCRIVDCRMQLDSIRCVVRKECSLLHWMMFVFSFALCSWLLVGKQRTRRRKVTRIIPVEHIHLRLSVRDAKYIFNTGCDRTRKINCALSVVRIGGEV